MPECRPATKLSTPKLTHCETPESIPSAYIPTSSRAPIGAPARPGLAALLDYARPADTIVVAGIDRLGRDAAEVMLTVREICATEASCCAHCVRASTRVMQRGRMVAGVSASLAELELELGRERRSAAREARRARGQSVGSAEGPRTR